MNKKLSALDYILFDVVKKEPIEKLDIVYHYTSVIELINNGFKLEKNEMFVPVTELPVKIQKRIIETIKL